MKKILIVITLLGLLTGYTSLSSQALSVNKEQRKGNITVNTSSETDILPDVAEISFAVKTSDAKSIQKATTLNKELSDKVYTELKAMINPTNGDYIKTSDFNASPIYSYVNSKKNLEKYEVSNRVIVHTKSIDKVGKMIDNAITAGATNVDNLSFSISNYDNQCDELIAKATQKAYNRAKILAKVINTSVTGINTLNTSCSANNGNQPRLYMAKNMLSAVADSVSESSSGISISNGVIKINANVNATFFVK